MDQQDTWGARRREVSRWLRSEIERIDHLTAALASGRLSPRQETRVAAALDRATERDARRGERGAA